MNYESTIDIPRDVIEAALRVQRWTETYMAGATEVQICGVGCRTFLTVREMLRENAGARVCELKITP